MKKRFWNWVSSAVVLVGFVTWNSWAMNDDAPRGGHGAFLGASHHRPGYENNVPGTPLNTQNDSAISSPRFQKEITEGWKILQVIGTIKERALLNIGEFNAIKKQVEECALLNSLLGKTDTSYARKCLGGYGGLKFPVWRQFAETVVHCLERLEEVVNLIHTGDIAACLSKSKDLSLKLIERARKWDEAYKTVLENLLDQGNVGQGNVVLYFNPPHRDPKNFIEEAFYRNFQGVDDCPGALMGGLRLFIDESLKYALDDYACLEEYLKSCFGQLSKGLAEMKKESAQSIIVKLYIPCFSADPAELAKKIEDISLSIPDEDSLRFPMWDELDFRAKMNYMKDDLRELKRIMGKVERSRRSCFSPLPDNVMMKDYRRIEFKRFKIKLCY